VTAEQSSTLSTLERFDVRAKERGITIMPAAGFYGGLGDLLATAALSDWTRADEVTLAIALDSWHPTYGTRRTGQRNTAARLVLRAGNLEQQSEPRLKMRWTFADPFGPQEVVELPFTETILLSRHLRGSDVHNFITTAPLQDLIDPNTPPPVPADDSGRSQQVFLVEAVARQGQTTRRAAVRGRDIYAVTAPLVVEAAERIVMEALGRGGAVTPAELFDARAFLEALCPAHLNLDL
jgi:short subunit dehydrogenase-like uncharacterized protein